ncbi:MAG TPA: hypothetical protein GXZ29_01880, partial [Clostridiales bacterium]|nr:hypothetical protein [Clostridiales bacterium]
TAVGKWVYDSYRRETGDTAATILVSTASPFKFPADVLKAIQPGSSGSLYPSHVHTENIESVYEIKLLEQLAKVSGWNIPRPLQGLQYKEIRHRAVCSREQIREQVIAMIDSQEMR